MAMQFSLSSKTAVEKTVLFNGSCSWSLVKFPVAGFIYIYKKKDITGVLLFHPFHSGRPTIHLNLEFISAIKTIPYSIQCILVDPYITVIGYARFQLFLLFSLAPSGAFCIPVAGVSPLAGCPLFYPVYPVQPGILLVMRLYSALVICLAAYCWEGLGLFAGKANQDQPGFVALFFHFSKLLFASMPCSANSFSPPAGWWCSVPISCRPLQWSGDCRWPGQTVILFICWEFSRPLFVLSSSILISAFFSSVKASKAIGSPINNQAVEPAAPRTSTGRFYSRLFNQFSAILAAVAASLVCRK